MLLLCMMNVNAKNMTVKKVHSELEKFSFISTSYINYISLNFHTLSFSEKISYLTDEFPNQPPTHRGPCDSYYSFISK